MTLPCDQPNSILMFPDATEKNEKAIIIFLQPQILPSVKGVGSLAEELCARLCSRFSNYMSHLQKCQPFRGKSKMELLGFFFPLSLLIPCISHWLSLPCIMHSETLGEENVPQLKHLVWVLSIPPKFQVDPGLGRQSICQSLRGQICPLASPWWEGPPFWIFVGRAAILIFWREGRPF